MDMKPVNSDELDNKEAKQGTNAQSNKENKSTNTKEDKKDNEKPAQETKQEASEQTQGEKKDKIGGGTCVVEYIGGSVWVDSKGDKWAKNNINGTNIVSQRKYSAQEYEERDDIKFMVGYGEMKLTIVE